MIGGNMFFGHGKKEYKEGAYLTKGIYLHNLSFDHNHIILNILLRTIILLSISLGMIGGFLTSFELEYSFTALFFMYTIFSIYFSMVYASSKKKWRDLGNIIFFALFLFFIFLFHVHANSGFYTVVNQVFRKMRDFFGLAGIREYAVIIQNENLTVTIAAIFIGMFLIILLNIYLSSSGGFFLALMITGVPLFVPIYMNMEIKSYYIFLLVFGYMIFLILKANGHYRYGLDHSFFINNKNQILYSQDTKSFKDVLLSVALIVFVSILFLGGILPQGKLQSKFKDDNLRNMTKDAIANFIMFGFSSFYNDYPAVGGMSGGMLGGVSNVKTDFQTDLIVTYTPYSNEAVYLKGFTGGKYYGDCWGDIYVNRREKGQDVEIFKDESMEYEASRLKACYLYDMSNAASGIMDVQNVGADTSYLYYPYYTLFPDYSFYSNHAYMMSAHGLRRKETKKYRYYPYIVKNESLKDIIPTRIHSDSVDPIYLEVPEANVAVIKNECDKIGIHSRMTENEIIESVKTYFSDNIPYTLKPGKTPYGEDFVNYFLTKNRKGYCAHFASAATLIFRQMNIPARYVEGYAFTLEQVLASQENKEKDPLNYYIGYSELGNSPVMNVEVSDAMAHAWVEIYVEGFGWQVVEMTPGSNEALEEEGFLSDFDSMMQDESNKNSFIKQTQQFGKKALSKMSFVSKIIWVVFILIFAYFVVKWMLRKRSYYLMCHQDNQKEALVASYKNLCDEIRICYPNFDLCRTHLEQLEFMKKHYAISVDVEQLKDIMEEVSFGNTFVLEPKVKKCLYFMKDMHRLLWKNANWKQKMKLMKR